MGEQVLYAERCKGYNQLVEARRARLESFNTGLPRALWWMVIWGALISIVVTFFFDMRSGRMHRWMTALMSGLLGLLIFLIATLDNPDPGQCLGRAAAHRTGVSDSDAVAPQATSKVRPDLLSATKSCVHGSHPTMSCKAQGW